MADCPFCAIAAGHTSTPILWADTNAIVIRPRTGGCTPGHVLVIPRTHATSWLDSWQIAAETMHAAYHYARAQEIGDCNLITSRGPAATQTVHHLHLHIVPRRPGDGLALPWTGQGEARVEWAVWYPSDRDQPRWTYGTAPDSERAARAHIATDRRRDLKLAHRTVHIGPWQTVEDTHA